MANSESKVAFFVILEFGSGSNLILKVFSLFCYCFPIKLLFGKVTICVKFKKTFVRNLYSGFRLFLAFSAA